MSRTDQAERAEAFAREAHRGQTDKAGEDYSGHLERVAARVEGDGARAVAWLHDVLEDTTATSATLAQAGFADDVIRDVEQLTREPHERYAGYIERLRKTGTERARRVKLADLADHLEHRPDAISRSLRHRYLQARKRLIRNQRTSTSRRERGRRG